jgi:hypothetical protein
MKHGCITSYPRRRNSQNNGLKGERIGFKEGEGSCICRQGHCSLFWDTHEIIFTDNLQKRKTINGDYYENLLQRLSDEIKRKRPHLGKKKVLLHQDNAPVHKSVIGMAKINELKFELLLHPPYSPPRIIFCFQT